MSLGDQFLALTEKILKLLEQPARQLEHGCVICFETEVKSVDCVNKHFVCEPCFQQHVDEYLKRSIDFLRSKNVAVPCPVPECHYVYSHKQLVLNGGEATATKLIDTARRVGELEGVRSLAYKRISSLRCRIEEALNLKCPSCKVVFVDYDACDAVKCAFCPDFFCGLCLTAFKSSSEAHQHAAYCPSKQSHQGDYFTPQTLKTLAHRDLKQKRVQEIIESLDAGEKQQARDLFTSLFSAERLNVRF
jgi:hypothetical protein